MRLYSFREVSFDEYRAAFARLRQDLGLSRDESGVLDVVGSYGLHLPPDELAQHSWDLDKGNPERPELPVVRAALQSCLDKGWCMVLTAEDCERDRQWRATDPYPMTDVSDYAPGQVTLTPLGVKLYTEYQRRENELFHEDNWVYQVAWKCVDEAEDRCRLEIYGFDQDLCYRIIGEVFCFPSPFCGSEVQVVGVEPPGDSSIGPWRRGRFRLIPDGWRAVVRCIRCDSSSPPKYWVQLPRRF